MSFLGTREIDDALTFTVNTHSPSTGAATDADAVPTYRVYEDETSTPILTGSMALIDSANTAGFYSEQITLSAANGLEVGKSYNIYITATVGGVAGTTTRSFQMGTAPLTSSDLPTNFGDLAITATTGRVTVGTNSDKTGYSISGTITTLDALDTAQDAQHSTTQTAIGNLNNFDPTSETVTANVTQIAGETASASGAVDFDQLAIITDGVPTSNTAVSSTVTNGTVASGTAASTQADDGVYYSINPDGSGIDLYLEFQIGSNFPNSLTLNGKYDAAGQRFTDVYAYDWVASAWELISSNLTRMNNTSTDANYSYPLLSKHRNGAGSTGEVRIRFLTTDTTGTYQLDIDQILLQSVSAAATAAEIAEATRQRIIENSYRKDYGITIDTVNGTAGTDIGIHGIPQNPSLNIADAYTLSQNARILTNTFFVNAGSDITLDRAYENWVFAGERSLFTIRLNGQTLTGAAIENARVYGAGVSTGNRIRFNECVLFASTLGNSIFNSSVLVNTITMTDGADHSYRGCYGRTATVIDMDNPTTATTLELLDFDGYITFDNVNANCTIFMTGNGQITFSNVTGGTMIRAGAFTYSGDDSNLTVTDVTVEEVREALDAQGYTGTRAGYIDKLNTVAGADGVTLATLQPNYAPAVAGDEMDLVDAPNATAVTAIQSGLATAAAVTAVANAITALENLSAAQVNAQVLDVLNTDTFSEPTGVPGASSTVTLVVMLQRLYKSLVNSNTSTSTKLTHFNDSGVAEWEKDLSDDGTTYTESAGNAV